MCLCIFKLNSNILDKSNDMKQLREQIRKLDERLDCEMQVSSSYFTLLYVGRKTTVAGGTQELRLNSFRKCDICFGSSLGVIQKLHSCVMHVTRNVFLCVCARAGAGQRGTGLGRRDGVSGEPS